MVIFISLFFRYKVYGGGGLDIYYRNKQRTVKKKVIKSVHVGK